MSMMRRINLPQKMETRFQQADSRGWTYYYAYERARESKEHGEHGQDYLTIFEDEDKLMFALCDGISQSYFGEIAAKHVGDALIRLLNDIGPREDPDIVSDQLHDRLKDLTHDAKETIEAYPLPDRISGLHREVLLSKKQLGSSTVYSCGRIDLPSLAHPEGRILLAWQGDVRIRLWSEASEQTERLGSRFNTAHQWNSRYGSIGGAPHVWMEPLVSFGREGALLSYSDGLRVLDSVKAIRPDNVKVAIEKESQHFDSDDISVFYVKWNIEE